MFQRLGLWPAKDDSSAEVSSSKPVKANMGTKNKMYFNEELKAWVLPGQVEALKRDHMIQARNQPPPIDGGGVPPPTNNLMSADLSCRYPVPSYAQNYFKAPAVTALNHRRTQSSLHDAGPMHHQFSPDSFTQPHGDLKNSPEPLSHSSVPPTPHAAEERMWPPVIEQPTSREPGNPIPSSYISDEPPIKEEQPHGLVPNVARSIPLPPQRRMAPTPSLQSRPPPLPKPTVRPRAVEPQLENSAPPPPRQTSYEHLRPEGSAQQPPNDTLVPRRLGSTRRSSSVNREGMVKHFSLNSATSPPVSPRTDAKTSKRVEQAECLVADWFLYRRKADAARTRSVVGGDSPVFSRRGTVDANGDVSGEIEPESPQRTSPPEVPKIIAELKLGNTQSTHDAKIEQLLDTIAHVAQFGMKDAHTYGKDLRSEISQHVSGVLTSQTADRQACRSLRAFSEVLNSGDVTDRPEPQDLRPKTAFDARVHSLLEGPTTKARVLHGLVKSRIEELDNDEVSSQQEFENVELVRTIKIFSSLNTQIEAAIASLAETREDLTVLKKARTDEEASRGILEAQLKTQENKVRELQAANHQMSLNLARAVDVGQSARRGLERRLIEAEVATDRLQKENEELRAWKADSVVRETELLARLESQVDELDEWVGRNSDLEAKVSVLETTLAHKVDEFKEHELLRDQALQAANVALEDCRRKLEDAEEMLEVTEHRMETSDSTLAQMSTMWEAKEEEMNRHLQNLSERAQVERRNLEEFHEAEMVRFKQERDSSLQEMQLRLDKQATEVNPLLEELLNLGEFATKTLVSCNTPTYSGDWSTAEVESDLLKTVESLAPSVDKQYIPRIDT